MGKRGPKPGTGGRPRTLPPEISQKHEGSPKLTVRLAPHIHDWVMESGGATMVRQLVEEAYEADHEPAD